MYLLVTDVENLHGNSVVSFWGSVLFKYNSLARYFLSLWVGHFLRYLSCVIYLKFCMSALLWSGKFRQPLHCSVCIGEPYWSCHNFAPICRRKTWNIRTVKEPEHLFQSRPWKSDFAQKCEIRSECNINRGSWDAVKRGNEMRNRLIVLWNHFYVLRRF